MGRCNDKSNGIESCLPLTRTVRTASSEVEQQVAEYFSLLSEPMRLHLLDLLRDGEKCVQELVAATHTSQANVSKHLKILWQAGILTRRDAGTSAYYRVEDEEIYRLWQFAFCRLAARVDRQARQLRAFREKQRGAIALQK